MTNKQFTVYINWKNQEKTETNEVVLKDGGQPIAEITSYEDAWILRDILNELHDENQEIKQLLHTILQQIDAEKINTANAVFSARILFTEKEFKKINEIWRSERRC